MGNEEALQRIERAAAKAVDPEEAFFDWVAMYHDRIMSVTGIPPDTLDGDGDEEITDEYYGVLWKVFVTGIDPVDAADKELRAWAPEMKKNTQSAEDFRREYQEHLARFEEMWG